MALTDDMLNELNKNHMGGLDNYGADDLYNMDDVWNEKPVVKKVIPPCTTSNRSNRIKKGESFVTFTEEHILYPSRGVVLPLQFSRCNLWSGFGENKVKLTFLN